MADEVSTAVADVEVAAVEEATAPGKLMSILYFFLKSDCKTWDL